jgi:hypothetical protein
MSMFFSFGLCMQNCEILATCKHVIPFQTTRTAQEAQEMLVRTHGSEMWQRRQFIMLITFFETEGIVNSELVLRGQTINPAFNEDVLQRFGEALPEEWRNCWLLHHNKAACHRTLSNRQALSGFIVPTLPQRALSPTSQCDL